MFTLTKNSINVELLKEQLYNPSAGGFASFEGWVRNYQEGKAVNSLEYEAYKELAENEAEIILSEAKNKFDILNAACAHRIGHLNIGELAVWIGVTSVHRAASFKACRYIIDEIKTRLPIWKKEYYADGSSEWVNCKTCAKHLLDKKKQETMYYSRQTILPKIGMQGQGKLKNSKVLVVGAGGLGCPVLQYLGGGGVGTIGICDFDTLDISNIHRQPFYQFEDIGKPKVELAAEFISSINPFIQINRHNEILSQNNIESIFKNYDLILDCTDNFETKFMINDTAVKMKKPVVFASIYQFEGQLWSYLPEYDSPCIRCIWQDIPQPGRVSSCTEVGVLGSVAGVLGTMQATLALNYLLGISEEYSETHLSLIDLNNLSIRKIKRLQNPDCTICGNISYKKVTSKQLVNNDIAMLEINMEKVSSLLKNDFEWVDIRSETEREQSGSFPYAAHQISIITDYSILMKELNPDKSYVIVCQYGIRSRYAASLLRENGYPAVYTLAGGIARLNQSLVES